MDSQTRVPMNKEYGRLQGLPITDVPTIRRGGATRILTQCSDFVAPTPCDDEIHIRVLSKCIREMVNDRDLVQSYLRVVVSIDWANIGTQPSALRTAASDVSRLERKLRELTNTLIDFTILSPRDNGFPVSKYTTRRKRMIQMQQNTYSPEAGTYATSGTAGYRSSFANKVNRTIGDTNSLIRIGGTILQSFLPNTGSQENYYVYIHFGSDLTCMPWIRESSEVDERSTRCFIVHTLPIVMNDRRCTISQLRNIDLFNHSVADLIMAANDVGFITRRAEDESPPIPIVAETGFPISRPGVTLKWSGSMEHISTILAHLQHASSIPGEQVFDQFLEYTNGLSKLPQIRLQNKDSIWDEFQNAVQRFFACQTFTKTFPTISRYLLLNFQKETGRGLQNVAQTDLKELAGAEADMFGNCVTRLSYVNYTKDFCPVEIEGNMILLPIVRLPTRAIDIRLPKSTPLTIDSLLEARVKENVEYEALVDLERQEVEDVESARARRRVVRNVLAKISQALEEYIPAKLGDPDSKFKREMKFLAETFSRRDYTALMELISYIIRTSDIDITEGLSESDLKHVSSYMAMTQSSSSSKC